MRATLSRHRRTLAALFAAAAAALTLVAARHHPRGVPVLVAAHDLRAGAVLRRGDVALRSFPAGTVPSGALRRAEGRVLSGPVRRGEPLTDAHFASNGLAWAASGDLGQPASGGVDRPASGGVERAPSGGVDRRADPSAVAVPVRLADAAVARLLRPGDRVDVLAARPDTPLPARTVAPGVPVVAVPRPGPDTDEGALIVVETGRDQAALLARAAVDSRLSVTILGA